MNRELTIKEGFKNEISRSLKNRGIDIVPHEIVDWNILEHQAFKYFIQVPFTWEEHNRLRKELARLPISKYQWKLWTDFDENNNTIHIIILDNSGEFQSWLS